MRAGVAQRRKASAGVFVSDYIVRRREKDTNFAETGRKAFIAIKELFFTVKV